MTSLKNDAGNGSLPTLRIGSRVRCTEDGMEGRITWANGLALKIHWDDGEQVTWRRDSLAERPIVILEVTGQDGEEAQIAVAADDSQTSANEPPGIAPEANPTTLIEPPSLIAVPDIPRPADMVSEPIVEPTLPTQMQGSATQEKLSALAAAARVLEEANQALSCPEMIQAMAAKGYWTSPHGKTPAATLTAAILREITTRKETSRFCKVDRGKFTRNRHA